MLLQQRRQHNQTAMMIDCAVRFGCSETIHTVRLGAELPVLMRPSSLVLHLLKNQINLNQ